MYNCNIHTDKILIILIYLSIYMRGAELTTEFRWFAPGVVWCGPGVVWWGPGVVWLTPVVLVQTDSAGPDQYTLFFHQS